MLLPAFGVLVGPARAETVDGLIAQWRERGDESEVALAGEATLLGRRARTRGHREGRRSNRQYGKSPSSRLGVRFPIGSIF